MKFKVLFYLFLIAVSTIAEARGGRSRGGSRGGSRTSYHPARPPHRQPVYHPPAQSSPVHRPTVHYPPVQSSPIYHPPVHIPAPPPKPSVPKPGATNSRDSSNIFIHNEREGRPRPAPTNDHKPTKPSAPQEPISRVNVPTSQNSPHPDWANPGVRQSPPLGTPAGNGHPLSPNKPYPDWANPGAKPVSPPIGLPTGNGHPPYPVQNPHLPNPNLHPSHPVNSQPSYPRPGTPPYPSSHPNNMPMPNAPHIGFQPGSNHGPVHQPPLGSPQVHPPLGAPPSMYGQGSPHPAQPGYPGGYHPPMGSPVIHNHYHMNSQPSYPNYGHSPMQGGGGGSYAPATIILPSQASSSPGIGQLVKEALVYSTINAGVNRIINGAPHHHYHSSNAPSQPAVAGGSTTSIVNNTTIITNTYGPTDQATTGTNANVPQGTYVPNNPGTYPASYPGSFPSNSPGAHVPNNQATYPSNTPTSGPSSADNVPIISGAVPPTVNGGMNIGPRADAPTVPNPLNTSSSSSSANNYAPAPNSVNNADGQNVNTTETPATAPTYYISEEELKNLTEILFAKDDMDLRKYITLNVQKKSTGNITDQAPQLLMYISPDLYDIPTIQAFKNIFDNYQFNSAIKENSTQETRREESLFLNTVLNTDTMLTAMKWLATKYYIESDDFEMSDTLRHIWFNKMEGSTSGFERVFLAELYPNNTLIGAQNWLYFHHKESLRDIDYMGYTEMRTIAEKAWLLKINMKMGDVVKQNFTMLIGVSPELEMALYTVCFYARPNDICPVSLGGNVFYLYTHTVRYFGKDLIDVGIKAF